VAYSVALRRRPAELRARATAIARNHPDRPRPQHFPPRHAIAWILGWIGMLLILTVAVLSVPAVIDGTAYLAGATKSVTFDPLYYEQTCDQSSCQTNTDGVLETGGAGMSVTWPAVVPLGKPFPVREPFWRWGLGLAMIDGDGTAAIAIGLSLLMEAFAVLVVIRAIQLGRNWRRHRQRQRAVPVPSAA
jgi:hypothetical protein